MSNHHLTRRTILAGLAGTAGATLLRKPARAQTTTIRVWTFLDPINGKSAREKVLKTLLDNFEQANPGVKVLVEPQNYQTMAQKFYAAHQTGTAPDVAWVFTPRLWGAIKLGALANLDDLLLKNWSAAEIDDIDSPLFRYGSEPGAHYHLPNSPSLQGQLIRADMFRDAGVDPKSLSTWDKFNTELQKVVTKDASGEVVCWAFGQTYAGTQRNPSILLSVLLDRNGKIFDDDYRAAWANPAGVEGLQMEVDQMRKYKISPETMISMANEDIIDQFLAGRFAIQREGTGRLAGLVAKFGAGNIGYLPTPSFEEGKYSPTEMTGWPIGVWSGSKIPELSAKLVEFLVNKDADKLWSVVAGQQPVRKSTVVENPDYFADPQNSVVNDITADMLSNVWFPPEGAGDGGWNDGLADALLDVMTNNTDPMEALKKAEDAFNRANRR